MITITKRDIAVFGLLLGVTAAANAQSAAGTDTVLSLLQSAMSPAFNKLKSQAISLLAVLSMLQFVITNYALLKSDSDIQTVIAKAVAAVSWVGICLYLINNGPQFISTAGDQMFGLLGFDFPSPASILASTTKIAGSLAALSVVVGGVGVFGSPIAGQLLIYVLLAIAAVGMFFSFKIFMLQLEIGLVAMLSPLSFAFLGMNALKDQGIAPFRALISLFYRIILLSVILSAFGEVSNIASSAISGLTEEGVSTGIGSAFDAVLSAFCAYLLLAYLVYKSDSIAASLAAGGTSMGTADVASAAAAGAAAGALLGTASTTAASAAGRPVQAMGDFLKSMSGGGAVTNAGGRGSGGEDSSLLSPDRPSMSIPTATGTNNSSESGGLGKFDGTTRGLDSASAAKIANKGVGPSLDHVNPPIPRAPGGSGAGASIGGPSGGNQTDQKLDKLIDTLSNQRGKTPTLTDRLADTNHHIAQERAATHVSINTHHAD